MQYRTTALCRLNCREKEPLDTIVNVKEHLKRCNFAQEIYTSVNIKLQQVIILTDCYRGALTVEVMFIHLIEVSLEQY